MVVDGWWSAGRGCSLAGGGSWVLVGGWCVVCVGFRVVVDGNVVVGLEVVVGGGGGGGVGGDGVGCWCG